jgi:hypothetical protein
LSVTSFNELSHDRRPQGSAWRRLEPAVAVRGYINNNWHEVFAVEINVDTREVRVEMPGAREAGGLERVHHRVLSPALYQATPGALTAASGS